MAPVKISNGWLKDFGIQRNRTDSLKSGKKIRKKLILNILTINAHYMPGNGSIISGTLRLPPTAGE
jgi:hypothetical protein